MKTTLDVEVDEYNRLVGLNIHDSIIRSIEIRTDNYAEFAFGQTSGAAVRLRFEGLGPFGFIGFRDHAVVSEVFLYRFAGGIPVEAWNTLWAGDFAPSDQGVDLVMKRIGERHRCLVLIVCAYGGKFACACDSVSRQTGSE